MAKIPEEAKDLLTGPQFGTLATVMEDGTPQVTPVWVDSDNGHVVVNTAEGRIKHRNIQRDPNVAITVFDKENPYRALTVRGRAELSREGAEDHIDALAKRYLGVDEYPLRQPGEVRTRIVIEPEKVGYNDPGSE